MTEDSSETSGYAMYRTEHAEAFGGVAILLPTPLKNALHEERRNRAAAYEEERRAAEARASLDRPTAYRATATPAPSIFANPENAPSIIKAFELGVVRRNRTRSHPVLRGEELLRVAARVQTMRDKDYQKRELELLEKIKAMGALRPVANPGFTPVRWEKALDFLREAHPHFQDVTGFVARQVALSVRSKKPLTIPPIHLWGVPGVGKTHYANDLADALGAPIRQQSMENAQTTAMLLGTERHWSTATCGIVFDQIVLGKFANPVFLIDEIDKAPRESRYDPLAALHSLLEPVTAVAARDAAMDITFDASLATFVATSNDPRKVPASLRSRFREFQIFPPSGEQALQAARVVVTNAVERLGVRGFMVPEARIGSVLAHLTAREIHHAVQDAAARAMEAGRMHLTLADLPEEAMDADGTRRRLH